MTQVIAHRTCPLDRPENSRSGIELAAELGADAVEIDLRLSRDGVPVLSHDPIVLRTTRWPVPVRWASARWLTSRTLVGSEETMPSFADALAATPEGLDVAVDVKDPRCMAHAIAVAGAAGRLGSLRLWSSSADAVTTARRDAPDQQRALLRNTRTPATTLDYLRDAAACGATAVSVMDVSVTAEVVAAGHELGLWVNAWVRTLDVQAQVLACAPDSIVTDWVREARQHLATG